MKTVAVTNRTPEVTNGTGSVNGHLVEVQRCRDTIELALARHKNNIHKRAKTRVAVLTTNGTTSTN